MLCKKMMNNYNHRKAIIVNALIRCERSDRAAEPAFELVRDDLDLWVMELDYQLSDYWDSQIEVICDHLQLHRALLLTLQNGSTDYTLHIAAEANEWSALRIPVRLSRLASECGFEIEICEEQQEAD